MITMILADSRAIFNFQYLHNLDIGCYQSKGNKGNAAKSDNQHLKLNQFDQYDYGGWGKNWDTSKQTDRWGFWEKDYLNIYLPVQECVKTF